MSDSLYRKITESVINGDAEQVRSFVKEGLDRGLDVTDILNYGLLKAMQLVGEQFERNEIYVTELLISARGVREGMEVIKPYLLEKGIDDSTLRKGKIVLGTVAGDLHDIGKDLLGMVLKAGGFEVIDLGVDVSSTGFVEAVERYHPDAVCLSALLTTTVKAAADAIEALSGVRKGLVIAIGGAAINQEIAAAIHADGYAPDAVSGAKMIENLLEQRRRVHVSKTLEGTWTLQEITGLQKSFFDLTGVGMVAVDASGVPFGGGEEFFSCSGKCCHKNCVKPGTAAMTYSNDKNAAVYRCRCGLMEASYTLMGEKGSLGALLCGHFMVEGDEVISDDVKDVPVLTEKQCASLCRFVGIFGKKLSDHIESYVGYKHLKGQEKTYFGFMKRQRELEEELKAAELTVLQNQVNPHFLFNSLNTIGHVALIEGDRDTEKLVNALARLMRYSLYQVKSTVTLADEVNTVNDYLMIQETRFKDRIVHRIDVEQSVLMAKMPCMILQPLVENACQHGLEPTKQGGIISIQGWLENGNVFLEVSDNGVGMSKERVQSIFQLQDIRSSKGGQVSGIGMTNVLSRLQYFFGSDCAWDISSAPGKGTTLQLSFPLQK